MSQAYTRHSIVDIQTATNEVLKAMDALQHRQKPPKAIINGMPVNVKSLRLQTFAKHGYTCASCGRVATHFALEKTFGVEVYHLNLWSKDEAGVEHLMTHDHRVARSLGGKDALSNTQTMCVDCNQGKSMEERELLKEVLKDLADKPLYLGNH